MTSSTKYRDPIKSKPIDTRKEKLIRIDEAGQHFPGGALSTPTLWRYVLYGKNGVRLQSLKIGRVRYTTERCIHEFVEQIQVPFDQVDAACRRAGF